MDGKTERGFFRDLLLVGVRLLGAGMAGWLLAILPSVVTELLIFRKMADSLVTFYFWQNLAEILFGEAGFLIGCRIFFPSAGETHAARERFLDPENAAYRIDRLLPALAAAAVLYTAVSALLSFTVIGTPACGWARLFTGVHYKTDDEEIALWARFLGFLLHLGLGLPVAIRSYRRGYEKRLAATDV